MVESQTPNGKALNSNPACVLCCILDQDIVTPKRKGKDGSVLILLTRMQILNTNINNWKKYQVMYYKNLT